MARKRAAPPAPTLTDAERADLDRRLYRMLTQPQRSDDSGLLVWLARDDNDEPQVMMWQPETPDEIRGATLFYEAAHGLGAFAKPVPKGKPARRTATETALIAAILQNRDDDTGYLVYADYLTEQGNTQGDFIRLCVQSEQLAPGDPAGAALNEQREELLAAHAEGWYAPLAALGLRPAIYGTPVPWLWIDRHGVIDEVTIDRPGILPQNASRLFAAAPFLRKLAFEPGHLDPVGLARVKQLAQIEELELSRTDLDADGLAALLKSKHLTGLKTLLLVQNPLGTPGAVALATWPGLGNLETLDVTGCNLDAIGLAVLTQNPKAANLKRLRLGRNTLDSDALNAVINSPRLTALTELDLAGASFDADAAGRFDKAVFAKTLRTLDLDAAGFQRRAFEAFTRCKFPALRALTLNNVYMSAPEAGALANAAFRDHLEELSIDNCHLGTASANFFYQARFPKLTALDISRNRIERYGLEMLASKARRFPALTKLRLWDNRLGAEAVTTLAKSSVLANITELDLNGNKIGPAGALALANSKHLPKLTSLTVDEKAIGKKGRQALIDRFGEGVMSFR
jgi:uncharacterized protein (TIGR02996 family)